MKNYERAYEIILFFKFCLLSPGTVTEGIQQAVHTAVGLTPSDTGGSLASPQPQHASVNRNLYLFNSTLVLSSLLLKDHYNQYYMIIT